MFTKSPHAITTVSILAFFAIWCISSKIQYENKDAALRNQFNATQQAVKIRYDSAWKNAAQQAQITDKYASDFKTVYQGIMEGRYKDGEAQMAKVVAEANPTLDPDIYHQLMDTVRSERLSTEESEKGLLAIKQQDDNLRTQAPSKWFVGNTPELVAQTVTSDRTDSVFSSGHDDNMNLYPTAAK